MPSTPAVRSVVGVAVVGALTAAIVAVSAVPGATPAAADALRPFGSCVELLARYRAELRRTATAWGVGGRDHSTIAIDVRGPMRPVPAPMAGGAAQRTVEKTGEAVGPGATGTNVQEKGVDEPDTAKIAGGLLFALTDGRLRIVRAGDRPELLSSTTISPQGYGGELLVDGSRVLVVGTHWEETGGPAPSGASGWTRPTSMPVTGRSLTTVVLLDVGDPANPRRVEEYEVEGAYLSARLTDGRVRLVTTSAPTVEGVQPAAPHGKAEAEAALAENRRRADRATVADILPRATRRDGSGRVLSEGTPLSCTGIRYAEDSEGATTVLVTTFVPGKGLAPVDTTGVNADGHLVYASADRLYVATSRWAGRGPAQEDAPAAPLPPPSETVSTAVHAFVTGDRDRTEYYGSGTVPGNVVGRWAFSYHDGHLRVATTLTASAPVGGAEPATSSSLFVLAERGGALVQTGRVDGLGKNEQIYAVRYFGPIATVVTFRRTDPLYVLDLSNPAAPRVRGELKIPGFSTYLHPVGDDRLLGVGHDADADGRVTGMQLSLFDLSDLSAPRQVDRLSLGHGYSQALQESRAFGYDPVRRLALLPFASPGAAAHIGLGVRVGADGSLTEAGRVAPGVAMSVERVLHDAGNVYAVGLHGVVAADGATLARTGAVSFR